MSCLVFFTAVIEVIFVFFNLALSFPSYFFRATTCRCVWSICSATSCILPGLSTVKTFHVPIYMFSLLFLNTRISRLITIGPSFHNWAFLVVLEFFWGEGAGLAPSPQPRGPGCLSSSGFYPLTCLAWVSLPVATLPPA